MRKNVVEPRIVIVFGVLLGVTVCVRAQSQEPFQNPHIDPCGNPAVESSAWTPVRGRVVGVINGDTVVISSERKRLLVHLVGIEAPTLTQPFGREAQEFLERWVKDRNVEVWVDPTDEIYKPSRPKEILGVLYLRDRNMLDANLELIRVGFARHKKSPPYKMSTYTECQYVKAEEQSRNAKRGLWRTAP